MPNGKQRVLTYEELIKLLKKYGEDDAEIWTLEEIKEHCWSKDPKIKERVNLLILWDGYKEDTWEPIKIIKKDDTVTLAKYAYDNNITDKAIWKWAKWYLKNVKKLKHIWSST